MPKYVTRMAKSGESESYAVKDTGARELISAEVTARESAIAEEASIREAESSDLKSTLNYDTDNLFREDAVLELFPKLELGYLYVDSETGTGTYYESVKYIRTNQNRPLPLCAGDIVSTLNKSECVFLVYKKNSDGKYTSVRSGWVSTDVEIHEDGEYEVLIRKPVESFIDDPKAIMASFIITKKIYVKKAIEDNRHGVTNLNAYITKDTPLKDVLELGDLYVDGNGNGTYSYAGNRIRTNQGYPLKLNKNDILYTVDKENSVFLVYKKLPNGKYESALSGRGFSANDFVVQENGEYEIVGRYPVQAYIQDPDAFMANFYVCRYVSLYKLKEETRTDIDDLTSLVYGENSLQEYFEMGDLYVDSSGTGTYSDALKRIRTIQNQPLSLKAGDVLYSTSEDYVFIVYRKLLNGKYESATPGRGFSSERMLIDKTGNYEIVARYPVESFITNFMEIASAIKLDRILEETSYNENKYGEEDVYGEELDETVESVQGKTKKRGLLIGIITDTHVNKVNAGYYDQTIRNLRRLDDRLNFNVIAHLGDIANAYQESNETVEYHIRYSMNKLLSIDAKRTMVALGNHDDNHFSGDAEKLEDSQNYGLTQRFNENEVVRQLECSDGIYENRSSNFYKDFEGLKIRLFFIDSTYQHTGFSTEMITWLTSALADAPQDYNFVILTHCGMTTEMNGGYGIANSEAFNALMETYKTRIYCYVCGHTHFDYVNYPHGFAQIALNCAVPNQPAQTIPEGAVVPARTMGTATQDCISILFIEPDSSKVELIRFGAGSDRTIPFTGS